MSAKPKCLNLGKIAAISALQEKINELGQARRLISRPLVEDSGLVERVYEMYVEMFRERGGEAEAQQVRNRKKFLMVALYLFSPVSLAGGRMKPGLRRKISSLFGLRGPTAISDNCAGLLVQYRVYADFRRDVNQLLTRVLAWLGVEE